VVLNVLALPLVVLGVSVPSSLLAAGWISAVLLLGIVVIGWLALRDDRFLTAVGRAAQWILNKTRRDSQPGLGAARLRLAEPTSQTGSFATRSAPTGSAWRRWRGYGLWLACSPVRRRSA
jgi:hypothetical protein